MFPTTQNPSARSLKRLEAETSSPAKKAEVNAAMKTYADHIDDVTGYLTQQLGKTNPGLRETGLDLALQRGWKLPDMPSWIRDEIHRTVSRGPMPANENRILLRQVQDRVR